MDFRALPVVFLAPFLRVELTELTRRFYRDKLSLLKCVCELGYLRRLNAYFLVECIFKLSVMAGKLGVYGLIVVLKVFTHVTSLQHLSPKHMEQSIAYQHSPCLCPRLRNDISEFDVL